MPPTCASTTALFRILVHDYPRLLSLMHHDKKNVNSTDINFTLLKAIGEPQGTSPPPPTRLPPPSTYRDLLQFLIAALAAGSGGSGGRKAAAHSFSLRRARRMEKVARGAILKRRNTARGGSHARGVGYYAHGGEGQ